MPCRQPDARELHAFLDGIELAVVAATQIEMGPLVDRLTGSQYLAVVGRPWWVGELPSSARTIRTVLLVSGYDKVNVAHSLTCLLQAGCPRLVVQTGVAGAFPSSGLQVGDLAVAASDTYADLGVISPEGWQSAEVFAEPLAVVGGLARHNTFPVDPGLVEAAARVFRAGPWSGETPHVMTGPFLTASQVTGTSAAAALLETRWGGIAESMEGAAAAHICGLYGVPFLEVRGISNLVVDRDRGSWKVEEAAALAAEATLMVCGRLDEVLVARRTDGDDDGADGGPADEGITWMR